MSDQSPTPLLLRLEAYFRYVYEEEQSRGDKHAASTRNLFAIVAATVGLVGTALQWLIPNPNGGLWIRAGARSVVMLGPLVGAAALLVVAFVCTLLSSRTRKFERLCDPLRLAPQMATMKTEDEVLARIISNYIVTVQRNFEVNEQKSRMLRLAWSAYLTSVCVLVVSPLWLLIAGIRP